jgi:chitin disaccharide deacetylase
MRRLIVNADDFGLCSGVVHGILHGIRHGIITSTSIMLTVPATQLALEQAHAHPNLDVGVHLTFTEGWPLLSPEHVPSLLNEQGRFLTAPEWLATRRKPDIGELRVEFKAQIEGVLVTQINASHLDLHTSIGYMLPEVFALTVDLASQYGLAMRYPLGDGVHDMVGGVALAAGIPLEHVEAMIENYRGLVADKHVPHPDRFVEAFPGHNSDPLALAELIRNLPDGTTELLTHPAFAKGSHRYLKEKAEQRAAELAALCDPRVIAAVGQSGIELVNFRQL